MWIFREDSSVKIIGNSGNSWVREWPANVSGGFVCVCGGGDWGRGGMRSKGAMRKEGEQISLVRWL